jgi:hypothetical protein
MFEEPIYITVLRWIAALPGSFIVLVAIVSGLRAMNNPPEKRTYTSVKGAPVRTDVSGCMFSFMVGSWLAYLGYKGVGWIYNFFV